MTTLMIKTHNTTGLKYFCKTTQIGKAFKRYNGSGVDWKIHIQKYGKDISTIIVKQFDETNNIQKLMLEGYALEYSELHNIVKSKEWANKKVENGLDGGLSKGQFSKEKYKTIMKNRRNNGNWVNGKTYEEIVGVKKALELKKIRSNTFKKIDRNGKNNSRANIIKVYDSYNNLMFSCNGTFRKITKEYNMPQSALLQSYLNNGKKIYENIADAGNVSILTKKGWLCYKGWYAIKYSK